METQIINGIKFIDEGQIREMEIKGEPFYEQWLLTNIKKLGKLDGIYIDAGAHVGNHTIYFSNHCKADEVWAFEPTPSTFEVLKENVERNCKGNVKIFNKAVGKENGFGSLIQNARQGQNRVELEGDEVEVFSLGNIKEKVALIKIDVEGMEEDVVMGAMPIIERDKPELFIESFTGYQWILDLLPEGYKYKKSFCNAPVHRFSIK